MGVICLNSMSMYSCVDHWYYVLVLVVPCSHALIGNGPCQGQPKRPLILTLASKSVNDDSIKRYSRVEVVYLVFLFLPIIRKQEVTA